MRFGFLCGKDVRSYPCTRRRPRPRKSGLHAPLSGPCLCALTVIVLILLLCCVPQWLCCVIATAALIALLCVM